MKAPLLLLAFPAALASAVSWQRVDNAAHDGDVLSSPLSGKETTVRGLCAE
jgi:hypothetical protein